MWFRIGQQVVCIKEGGWGPIGGDGSRRPAVMPIKGQIYTIEGFGVGYGEIYLWLCEVPDAEFLHTEFRPVVNTDISVFKRMLAPNPSEVEHVGS